MKKLLIIFLPLLIYSCTQDKNEFQNYLETLDELNLPLSFNINNKLKASKYYDSTLFESYKHVWTYAPYGIAFRNNNIVGIIEYSIADNGLAPFLIILDNKGNKIDSLNILGNSGFWEQGQTIQNAVLDSELQLIVTDSTISWEIDKEYNITQNSKVLSVIKTTYQIQGSGLIKQIDRSKPLISKVYENSISNFSGIYEYNYEYNTDLFVENHYLEFKNGIGFYYGTSDDFDIARENYNPGFFKAQMNNFKVNKIGFSFSLYVNDSMFFTKPITPINRTNENKSWDVGIRRDSRDYKGRIFGDTILIQSEGIEPRLFIKNYKHS